VLEEALQHKDDHHSVRNSTIHSELVRISDRMGGFKGDIESVIKSIECMVNIKPTVKRT
jgi:hypothetical protein